MLKGEGGIAAHCKAQKKRSFLTAFLLHQIYARTAHTR